MSLIDCETCKRLNNIMMTCSFFTLWSAAISLECHLRWHIQMLSIKQRVVIDYSETEP